MRSELKIEKTGSVYSQQRIHTALILILVCVLVVVSCSGCSHGEETSDNAEAPIVPDKDYIDDEEVTPGYKLFILREGVGHFSFEYPDDHEQGSLDIYSDITFVTFHRSLTEDIYYDSTFSIIIFQAGKFNFPNANTALEYDILLNNKATKDFQILERSSINIGGVEAELLVNSCFPEKEFGGFTTKIQKNRDIYFNHKGYIWDISMITMEEVAEVAQTYFDHMLETFKIID